MILFIFLFRIILKELIVLKDNKLVYIIVLLILCATFTGCNSILESKKPNAYYYTGLFSKCIKEDNSFLGTVLDTNLYKEKTLSTDNKTTVKSFIKNLHNENFINKPKDLPKNPIYKMYFTFKADKYVINVYNENYVSIYPWDGDYTEDYIDMRNLPISFNLYSLCKFLIPR